MVIIASDCGDCLQLAFNVLVLWIFVSMIMLSRFMCDYRRSLDW
jgi:hypothetical protein